MHTYSFEKAEEDKEKTQSIRIKKAQQQNRQKKWRTAKEEAKIKEQGERKD